MEGISYLFEKPKRGDLIVFKTDGIPNLKMASGLSSQTYVKRLAGLPGEELRIADGKLYVNGTHVPLTNVEGEIKITNSSIGDLSAPTGKVIVPEDHYFVLGDNSPNSSDSRYWGFVPASNIKGRMIFRLFPFDRIGGLR